MRFSHRVLWLLIGGIVLPTLVLGYLGMRAALDRQELAELRLRQVHEQQVRALAREASHWVERRTGEILAQAAAALRQGDQADLEARFARIEAADPAVRVLFLLDADGAPRWPPAQTLPLSEALLQHDAMGHPFALGPGRKAPASAPALSEETTERAQYESALQSFRALLRQSDPWLRALALDLIARCHVAMEQWEDALAAYRQLAAEYGATLDGAGVPIRLGVQYEVAYVQSRLGRRREVVEGYLEAYEQLVRGRAAMPVEQRRVLARMTREALADMLREPGAASGELVARFGELEAQHRKQERHRAFRRYLEQYGLADRMLERASGSTVQHLAARTDGRPLPLYWMATEGGALVGMEAAPDALAAELRVAGWMQRAVESGAVKSVSVDAATAGAWDQDRAVASAVEQGAPSGPGSEQEPSTAVPPDPDPPDWAVPIDALPGWRLTAAVPPAPESRGVAALYVWLGALAALMLLGGVFGLVRAAQGRLKTAQLQADFVSAVSHELRTPLTSIRLFSEMLLDEDAHDAAKRRGFAQSIHRECRRLEHLVRTVLAFAQAQKGNLTCQPAPADMAALVRGAVAGFQPFAAKEQIALNARLAADLPVVRADPERLESVVFELLENAARYGGPQAEIQVDLFARNGSVVLEVGDRGPGIRPEERRRIFRPFFRGKEGVRQGKGGSGLGLAVVQRIVAAHGGTVDVRPRPGGGSAFSVILPVAAEMPDARA